MSLKVNLNPKELFRVAPMLCPLSEPGCATTHDLALAHKLSVELGAVEREVDIEVYTVESTLGGIHPLKVLLEVLSREVRRESDDFLDTCAV